MQLSCVFTSPKQSPFYAPETFNVHTPHIGVTGQSMHFVSRRARDGVEGGVKEGASSGRLYMAPLILTVALPIAM